MTVPETVCLLLNEELRLMSERERGQSAAGDRENCRSSSYSSNTVMEHRVVTDYTNVTENDNVKV